MDATAIKKIGCVDVNNTVHMDHGATVIIPVIFVCDVAHEWFPYPFCVIVMCDSYKRYES